MIRSGGSDGTTSDASAGHCHSELGALRNQVDRRARKKLIIASILCLIFTVGEAVGMMILTLSFLCYIRLQMPF